MSTAEYERLGEIRAELEDIRSVLEVIASALGWAMLAAALLIAHRYNLLGRLAGV